MLNKLKQFKDIREQAKTLQNTLSQESVTVKEGGITLVMDGNLSVKSLDIAEDMLSPSKKEKLQKEIIKAYEEAMKKMQRIMAMKMKEMGGLPNIPGLS
ncbi:MAG: nucleoid-associated protein, YbaB/EbfC family [Candidatus Magasanikbacteria bacterium CG10_big_fil_rev_8_21_14_0_10_42_10]|uniref:Nucleoid-associated protein, YbaB/EbfC family n=2 Tax=Candidatus Magasanikiibacteriota TaxID=1752731 RepID=A0A2H0TWW9_9BACT|nr:MAG: nucleoid-associated protein, YbaB/EbfC family [Candidatus Magasanikbacteria bacterium CG10_big_fil_rev_8_21_14_0_10_42_10]PIZ92836.1 MAG: nucleoid-associated protein, YbaB/EbfC family [Candidatus Magasanikbacteria bacterium CG_4_10_14_0_2_um_filter_41_10]